MTDESGRAGGAVGGAIFDPIAAGADLGLTPEEFAPLLPRAAVEIRLRLDAVRQGMAENDLEAVALNSHTMKSVAATLGAEAARQAAQPRAGRRAGVPGRRALDRVGSGLVFQEGNRKESPPRSYGRGGLF
jgi:hypothetical protein